MIRNVHRNFIHNSLKIETILIFVTRIDKMCIYKMDDNITMEKNCHKITWLSHMDSILNNKKLQRLKSIYCMIL